MAHPGIQKFAWNAFAEMQTTASQAAFGVTAFSSIVLALVMDLLIQRCFDLVRRSLPMSLEVSVDLVSPLPMRLLLHFELIHFHAKR